MLAASLAGLAVAARLTLGGRAKGGLVVAVFCFVGSALLLYLALCGFLPGAPITESVRRAHTAQGAYLKNILYFLPWAVVFVLLPFHLVVALRREMRTDRRRRVYDLLLGRRRGVEPEDTVYVRVWWLGLILSGAALYSLVATFYLLDNIKPGPYMNMFTQLVFWRILLYFALGLGCLIWYAQTLNALKRECLFDGGASLRATG